MTRQGKFWTKRDRGEKMVKTRVKGGIKDEEDGEGEENG